MSIRYLFNTVLTLAAGFLVVATQAFAPGTIVWLGFGIGIGATVLSAGIITRRVGLAQRLFGVAALLIGAWLIVESLVFAPATVLWLSFASAIALVALALSGLAAHELTTERVVHSFEVEHAPANREREPVAA